MCPPLSTADLPAMTFAPRFRQVAAQPSQCTDIHDCRVLYVQGCRQQDHGDRQAALTTFQTLLTASQQQRHSGLAQAARLAIQTLETEMENDLGAIAAVPPPAPSPEVDRLLAVGQSLHQEGHLSTALETYQAALPLAAIAEDPVQIAACLNGMGTVHLERQQFDRAETLFRAAAHILAETREPDRAAVVLHNWGLALLSQGKTEQAFHQFQRALESWQAGADTLGVALTLICLGQLYAQKQENWFAMGSFEAAADVLRGLAVQGDVRSVAACLLESMAHLYEQTAHETVAIAYLMDALALRMSLRTLDLVTLTLYRLGTLHQRLDHRAIAHHYYRRIAAVDWSAHRTYWLSDRN